MKNTTKIECLAIITGGKKGLGAALAQAFSRHNVKVVVTSRYSQFVKYDSISEMLTEQKLDVTDIKSIEMFFKWLKKIGRPIHFFVNNAGVGVFKPLKDTDILEWKSVIETNLTGAFLCAKYAYPLLKAANGARVINIGSISEMRGLEKNGVYAASKLGLRALSRTINEEWHKENIFCTHVILGAVATEIWNERKEFLIDDMLNVDNVSKIIVESIIHASNIRLDTLEILPKKGILWCAKQSA